MPVIPATQEAEEGELPEPGRWRLQWAKIAPLHSSLVPGNRANLCLKKKKEKKQYIPININLNIFSILFSMIFLFPFPFSAFHWIYFL